MAILFSNQKEPLGYMTSLIKSLSFLGLLTLVFGCLYPAVVTGLAQILFPYQAQGSFIQHEGRIVGSELIGQNFSGTVFFQSRPSMTTPPYNGALSAASNWAPGNPLFQKTLTQRIKLWQDEAKTKQRPPLDLITASASGLDPHISVEAALWQIPTVSLRTGISRDKLKQCVESEAQLGLFGGPRYVNVLKLNIRVQKLLK